MCVRRLYVMIQEWTMMMMVVMMRLGLHLSCRWIGEQHGRTEEEVMDTQMECLRLHLFDGVGGGGLNLYM